MKYLAFCLAAVAAASIISAAADSSTHGLSSHEETRSGLAVLR